MSLACLALAPFLSNVRASRQRRAVRGAHHEMIPTLCAASTLYAMPYSRQEDTAAVNGAATSGGGAGTAAGGPARCFKAKKGILKIMVPNF